MWIWTDVGPVLPWLITSVSVAYVAYIHWKLRKQFRRKSSDPSPKINPSIDKHKSKVKHVFRGEHLEKEEFDSGVKITTGADIEDLDTEDIDADDRETTEGGRPRGRKSAYSYFVSECAAKEDNPLCQTSAERRIFAEFAKRCAHMWKKLTEEEKQHFHQLSDEDKQRYEREMKTFRRQQHHKRSRHSSSRSKSPKKEPLIVEEEEDLNSDVMDMAFDLFANEEMPIVRTQRPSIDTNNEEILTELVQRWNRSDQAFKDKFLDRIRLQSVAFNKSFSQSIRDDDESGVGPEDDPNVCKDGVNCGSDEEVVLEEDCGKKLSLCRCWRSETFPYCDGTHKQYNKEFDDNVGPVNIEWSDNIQESEQQKTLVEADIHSMNASTELSSLEMIDSNGSANGSPDSRSDADDNNDNNMIEIN